MPWFVRPTEYICNDCGVHFHNRAAAPPPPPEEGGYGSSPVIVHGVGGGVTRCTPCATRRNQRFHSPVQMQGRRLGVTITYRIHGGGNFTFLGGQVHMPAMMGATDAAMAASGALGLMAHPAYAGGMIRPPGHYSGANLTHNALAPWPGAPGMAMHHVHVGGGGATRVLFGWTARAYPAPNAAFCQAVTLYIGS